MNLEFDGSHIAITAGASGIGYAIAQAFVERGAVVHVCDLDEGRIAEINSENSALRGYVANVGSYSEVASFMARVRAQTDKLDVLVNNAGIAGPTARVEDIEGKDWDETIKVNLNGAFYTTRAAVPLLRANGGGSIINIASSAAFHGYPFRSPYAASKWALIGFTKTLAMELGPVGIRVNAICPGSVKGPRIDSVIRKEAKLRELHSDQVRQGYERQVSMRSFVDTNDIAQTILFLSSKNGAMISGQALGVDGHTETLTNY